MDDVDVATHESSIDKTGLIHDVMSGPIEAMDLPQCALSKVFFDMSKNNHRAMQEKRKLACR